MYFSQQQLDRFQTEGYIAIPDFWNKLETTAIQNEISRLKRDGLLRNVATEGDGKTPSTARQNLQLCPMYNKSDFVRAMPFSDKVTRAVSELIGDPVLLHLDQVFLKPACSGAGTNWHQDNAYFKITNPLKGTAMWTAVHNATVANGTLHLVPGSFRQVYEHSRDPESDHHIRCYPPEEQAVPVELPAGGVVFFCYGMAHCTLGNNTAKERAGLALHFLNADYVNLTVKDVFDIKPYLTGPLATGGLAEYGVKVKDTWPEQVERLAALKV
jgi:ectoine hydroxylase-related dioxygenase (phytanoyl-CoA dioxygenase family)